jgi:hypothetical protein
MEPLPPLWIRVVVVLIVLLCFAVTSWLCLFRTYQVQQWAIEKTRNDIFHPHKERIRSPRYFRDLRTLGFISCVAAFFLLYVLIKILVGS